METREITLPKPGEKKDISGRPEEKMAAPDEKFLEEGVKSTKAVIQTFLQTLKAYRLYEANHPSLTRFLERLKKDFDEYFDEFDSFSLQVGEHRLFYRGKVVYESQDVKESLAFVFFKDGIRELRFFKGLEFQEVVDFLSVVRKSDFVNRMEDDLVTLLWEKDFSHITFTTVDDFLESGTTFVPATEEDFQQGLEFRGLLEGGLEGGAEKEPEEGHVLVAQGLRQAFNLAPGQSLVQACQLTPDEMKEINLEVQQEQHPGYVFVLINNLIEILLHLGEDVDAYENMIGYFERVIKSLLEQGDFGKIVAILKRLNDTMESIVLKDKQIFAIRRITEIASHPDSILRFGKVVNGQGDSDSESLLQYLHLLSKQAIPPLCQLLGELEGGKWKKAVGDHLVKISREDVHTLGRFLSTPDPFLVCDLLSILGRIGNPSTLKYLSPLVAHQDPKVREETLHVAQKLGEKGKDLVRKFLRDPAPGIRGRASLAFARMMKGEAFEPLQKIILSEDFIKRDYEEKTSFFKALVETGAQETIPVLKKIAKTRKWFNRTKWNEMRTCASNALKLLEA